MSASAPRMAPAKSFDGQPASRHGAVRLDRLQRVHRAGRGVTAAGERTEHRAQRRRNRPAIKPDAGNQNVLNRVHSVGFVAFNNFAFRNVVKKSFSTAAYFLPAMEGRATNTRSTATDNECWFSRNASRKRRRARLRTTAPPTRREVITPSRDVPSAGRRRQLAIRQPMVSRSPPSRKRAKSRPCLMRELRSNRRRFGASAAIGSQPRCFQRSDVLRRERLYGGQPFASHPAAVAQDAAPALLGVAVQKAVLPFSADLGRLILSLHKISSLHTPRIVSR